MTVANIARRPVTAGIILWLAGLVALPAPLIAHLALAGPLVVLLDKGLEPRPDFDLARVCPAAALAGAAAPAWLLAGSRLDPRRRPVLSGITLGLLAVIVACALTVADQVFRSEGRDLVQGIALFVLGLLVVGWLACAVAIHCGLAWAWAFRRPRLLHA